MVAAPNLPALASFRLRQGRAEESLAEPDASTPLVSDERLAAWASEMFLAAGEEGGELRRTFVALEGGARLGGRLDMTESTVLLGLYSDESDAPLYMAMAFPMGAPHVEEPLVWLGGGAETLAARVRAVAAESPVIVGVFRPWAGTMNDADLAALAERLMQVVLADLLSGESAFVPYENLVGTYWPVCLGEMKVTDEMGFSVGLGEATEEVHRLQEDEGRKEGGADQD